MTSALGQLAKVIQTQTLIIVLFEDLTYRQIHLDGRSLPRDPNPSFMGYSVGRWEGDTLVVESTGFNDRSWLDGADIRGAKRCSSRSAGAARALERSISS